MLHRADPRVEVSALSPMKSDCQVTVFALRGAFLTGAFHAIASLLGLVGMVRSQGFHSSCALRAYLWLALSAYYDQTHRSPAGNDMNGGLDKVEIGQGGMTLYICEKMQ